MSQLLSPWDFFTYEYIGRSNCVHYYKMWSSQYKFEVLVQFLLNMCLNDVCS